jgi:hypothetical protein
MKSFYSCLKRKCIFFFLFLISSQLRANYFAGGSIGYQSLGNNQYLVSVKIIRDCTGDGINYTDTINVSSSSCAFSQDYYMSNPVMGGGINICPSYTTCDGGSEVGLQEYTYIIIITLPAACSDWIFSMRKCCRPVGISTIQNPATQEFYIEAALNNLSQDNNSTVNSNSIHYAAVGQTSFFNSGTIDVDGDSLVYSLVDAQISGNNSVVYNAGFSGSNPLSSTPALTIDPLLGDISMHAISPEYSIIAVKTDEYRNGISIGYSVANYIILSYNSSNSAPSLFCPSFTTNIEATEQFCLDIISNDPDPNDTLTMLWNNGIAGGVFTVSIGQFPVGHFCWTPGLNDISPQPYTFTVTVRDNACPANAISSCSISLIVTPYTSVNSIENNARFIFSPNPTSGLFRINATDELQVTRLIISDAMGKKIATESDRSEYSLSGFNNGIYFLEVYLNNGSSILLYFYYFMTILCSVSYRLKILLMYL